MELPRNEDIAHVGYLEKNIFVKEGAIVDYISIDPTKSKCREFDTVRADLPLRCSDLVLEVLQYWHYHLAWEEAKKTDDNQVFKSQ